MKHRKTMAGHMLAFTLIINSLLLMVLGFVLTSLSGNTLEQELIQSMEKVLTQTNSVLDTYLTDIRSNLVKLGSRNSAVACMNGKKPSFAESLPYEREMDERLSGIDLFNPIEDVLILGCNGYVYNLKKRMNLLNDYDFTACEWFREAVDVENGIFVKMLGLHDQMYYHPLTERTARTRRTFSLSMAVTRPTDYRVIGAIVCNLNIQKLGDLLEQGNYEQGGRIALIDTSGMICAASDRETVGTMLPFELPEDKQGHYNSNMNGATCLICHCASEISGWQLVFYIPLGRIAAHSRPLWTALAMLLFACLALNTVFAVSYSRSIRRPVDKLTESLAKVDANHITPVPVRTEYRELELISGKFNELLEHINELIQKDYLTQLELSRFQMYALRGQINPHFLFNTLQLLQTEIVFGNVEKSNSIVISLSQLLRYNMADGNALVTVGQEADYLQKYLMLFESKYENRLHAEIEIAPETSGLMCLRLLLQPVVENVIRHAVDTNPGQVTVHVQSELKGDDLMLAVSDNGGGIAPERLEEVRAKLDQPVDWMHGGIGLSNVHQRIRTFFGPGYGLQVESCGQVTTVTLRLPRREGTEGGKG